MQQLGQRPVRFNQRAHGRGQVFSRLKPMKKLWTEEHHKRVTRRRNQRLCARRRRKPRALSGDNPVRKTESRKLRHVIPVPKVFSLSDSPDETIKFLYDLRSLLRSKKYRVHIDLKPIQTIHPGAVAAFVAVMDSAGETVSGNVPLDEECRRRLDDFGFFEFVKGVPNLGTRSGTIRFGQTGIEVDSNAIHEIIQFGLRKLDTSPSKHGPSYSAFVEATANTFQHASSENRKERKVKWWAGAYYDEEKQAVCFTAVDLGVGIFRSFNWRQKREISRLSALDKGEALRMLLERHISSRTRDRHRGRGLPNLRDACLDGRIGNLLILSNNSLALVDRHSYRQLEHEFRGVVVYWEVANSMFS